MQNRIDPKPRAKLSEKEQKQMDSDLITARSRLSGLNPDEMVKFLKYAMEYRDYPTQVLLMTSAYKNNGELKPDVLAAFSQSNFTLDDLVRLKILFATRYVAEQNISDNFDSFLRKIGLTSEYAQLTSTVSKEREEEYLKTHPDEAKQSTAEKIPVPKESQKAPSSAMKIKQLMVNNILLNPGGNQPSDQASQGAAGDKKPPTKTIPIGANPTPFTQIGQKKK